MPHKIQLKGLAPEQVDRLLPEGLISLCWRGSVAHGMYVPKSDPDSIDDKDVIGIYVGPLEHYLGFGRDDVYERWEGEWDRLREHRDLFITKKAYHSFRSRVVRHGPFVARAGRSTVCRRNY